MHSYLEMMIYEIAIFTCMTHVLLCSEEGYIKHHYLNSLGIVEVILQVYINELISWAISVRLSEGECHRMALIINQHWFGKWLGTFRIVAWHQTGDKPIPEPMRAMIADDTVR